MVLPADEPLRAVAARLAVLAEAQPDQEVCGLVVSSADGAPEVWPFQNRAVGPACAYEIGPPELLQALRRLDLEGRVLLAVYHSHLAGGPDLSTRDIEAALVDGRPLLPGVAQVVVELASGRAVRVRAHRLEQRPFEVADLWPSSG